MNRLAILLLLVLVPSALYLVRVRHESRQLFAALERAKQEQKKLSDEAVRLQARRTELTSAMAAERGAERLGMRVAGPDVTWYVNDPGVGALPAARSAAARSAGASTPASAGLAAALTQEDRP